MPKHTTRTHFYKLILCFSALLTSLSVHAQVKPAGNIQTISAAIDTLRNHRTAEKLYLQFDKPYYAIGDTIWFKAYLFNAAYLEASTKSGLFYIELTNDSNVVVKRIMVPLSYGMSWGNIELNAGEIPQGNYTLRAFTNWMRNFGEDYIFKKSFYFVNTAADNWLVNTRVSLSKNSGLDKVGLNLKFDQFGGPPVALHDLQLSILDGKKTWYKGPVQTRIDGTVAIDFSPKTPAKSVTLIAEEKGKNVTPRKLVIPIAFNRTENTDLQFMPEGGNLVAGLPAVVGFKAIGEDGKAADVEGAVYDSHQQQVATFKSVHKGMGVFTMIPQAGETYTAKTTLPVGLAKTFNLPAVKNDGTTLRVTAIKGRDSLSMMVTATQNGSFYLIGQSRGIVCYKAMINLTHNVARSQVATITFPTGIAHFTLFNADMQPLNERMVFIDHHDDLKINITPDKPVYAGRDSVTLQVQVKDNDGSPLKGNFSLSVTDDSQVKTDSAGTSNMVTNLLFTSDLKGEVEDPGYYFRQDKDGGIAQQLDNVMLTQGWVGYDWKEIQGPLKATAYPPEIEFAIKGRVNNVFNKPIVGTHVVALSSRPFMLADTVTNSMGRFTFNGIVPIDTPIFVVQARNKRGRSFNVNVDVDEFKPLAFTVPTQKTPPWYVNVDTTLSNYIKTTNAVRTDQEKLTANGHLLKEVVIKSKKIVKGSQNLNGPGEADVVMDQQELEKAGKKTILDLLQERIKGFKVSMLLILGAGSKAAQDNAFYKFITDEDPSTHTQPVPHIMNEFWFYIDNKPVKFIIDGVSLYRIMTVSPGLPILTDVSNYFKSNSAEDVKGIEVMVSSKYTSKYVPIDWATAISPADIAFVEITTRSGSGPGIKHTPGVYLYKPMPFSLPKQFYSPKYTAKNRNNPAKDLRSTIYWTPNVVTDKDGKATVTFFTADKKATYSVKLEGTDWNGLIGTGNAKINVAGR